MIIYSGEKRGIIIINSESCMFASERELCLRFHYLIKTQLYMLIVVLTILVHLFLFLSKIPTTNRHHYLIYIYNIKDLGLFY